MKILKTDLYGVMKIELESFCDHRGKYTETYNEDAYNASGVNVKFIQDDISFSKKNVFEYRNPSTAPISTNLPLVTGLLI